MSDSPAWALQEAIYQVLTGDAAIQHWVGDPARVYDAIPTEALFPLLQIGASRILPLKGVTGGQEHIVSINAFSRWGGRQECKRIASAVHNVLQNARFTLGDCQVVQARMVFEDLLQVRDPETFQAAMRYRFAVVPLELAA